MPFCRNCGGKSPEDALFCAHCGHRLHPPPEEATSVSDPRTAQVTHTPPPETPPLLSQPLQAIPSKDGEEEEEEKRRAIPPAVPPEPPATGNVPSVQGTPQVGTVPSVPGLGGTAASTLTAGTLAKVLVIAATCAAVIFAGIKVLPPILSHPIATPVPVPTPTPSLSQLSIYVSSADGNIYALNASSGTLRWKYPTGSQATHQIQVADGAIYYIVDSDATQSSTMYAINEHNGTLIRQYQLPYFQLETGSFIPDFTVVNGVIYFSSPAMVFALSANHGNILWQYSWYGRGASAPVVVNNVVYYVTGVGIIHAFNIHNGTLLWKHDLGPGAVAPGSIMGTYPTPVVTNDTMYVVGWLTDNMYAINLRDQTPRWHTHLNSESTEALFAANGVLYIDTSPNSPQTSTIHALRAENGTQLWSRNNFSLQLIDEHTLYGFAVDSNGSITNDLYALRSSDGTTVWHIQIGSPYTGKVAASHMVVYVITDTTLYALRANDRSILWQTPISGYMVGPTFSSASFPAASPTSLLALTPTPSQTLLYSANWTNGFNGWNGSSEWSAANGELRSDGREHGHPDSILSPFHPTTADYAIEARIQIVSLTGPNSCYIGIRGRASENNSRYDGYFGGYFSVDGADIELMDYGFSPNSAFHNLNYQSYTPDLALHAYRVEFRGNQITLKIDGNLLVQATDNNSSAAGLVGLANGGCPINVSSFQVFAL